MVAIKRKDLDSLYEKYGFRLLEQSNWLRIYALQRGYFYNAEMVPLGSNPEAESIEAKRSDLERAGYSVRIQRYESLLEAEQKLFQGFFNTHMAHLGLRRRADDFRDRQARRLGCEYEYIPAPYEVVGGSRSAPSAGTPVVELIGQIFAESGARLVMLEAAAGFGKTCTAFEVLDVLLTIRTDWIPMVAELSKNREARIFRHVLLDEVDRTFDLQLPVVTDEIRSGRIPLIVDGFDEILSRQSVEGDPSAFEEAESMLDTIGELLSGNAKILVTTRRTASLSSEAFDEWVAAKEGRRVEICRLSIGAPSLDNWIGAGRRKELERSGFPLEALANPVLLSFIRSQADLDFSQLVKHPEAVVNRYLNSMLEREQERQDLRMSPEEQLRVLHSLALAMLDGDYTHEHPAEIRKALTSDPEILRLLEQTRKLYVGKDSLRFDELIDKLLVHALLDRPMGGSRIGFINDFVLGTLQGDVLVSAGVSDWLGSEGQIDRIATAYKVRPETDRELLWEVFEGVRVAGEPQLRLALDIDLRRHPVGEFVGCMFESITVRGATFGGENSTFKESTFTACIFRDCVFDMRGLSAVGFVECHFYSCVVRNSPGEGVWEAACSSNRDSFLPTLTSEEESESTEFELAEEKLLEIRRSILEQFWPPGRPNFGKRKRGSTLLKGHTPGDVRLIPEALDGLIEEGILSRNRGHGESTFEIELDNLAEIRRILGRE